VSKEKEKESVPCGLCGQSDNQCSCEQENEIGKQDSKNR